MLFLTLLQQHQSSQKNVLYFAFKVNLKHFLYYVLFSFMEQLLYFSCAFVSHLLFMHVLLTGISERVADIKTRAQSMKCLTTFCEAVGPGFIFERVSVVVLTHGSE